MGNVILAAIMLAVIVEALVENFGQRVPSQHKTWVAALLGITLCLFFGVDAIGVLVGQFNLQSPLSEPYLGVVGSILTGLLIARGANYFNDLVSRLRVTPAPSQTVDRVLEKEGGE